MTVLAFRPRPVKPKNYEPDPRNGEVYATEFFECVYANGDEVQIAAGFVVVHMSRSGGSAGISRGYDTLAEAQSAAREEAIRRNAVLLT